MPSTNYSKTVIYKINCKDSDVKYYFVGATTDISKVKSKLKHGICTGNQTELFEQITENGGWDNWSVTIIEEFTKCTNKTDSNVRVEFWKTSLKAPDSSNIENISSVLAQKAPDSSNIENISSVLAQKAPENENIFNCISCFKNFSKKSNLVRHSKYGRCKVEKQRASEMEQLIISQQKRLDELEKTNMKVVNNNNNNNTINVFNNTIVNNNISYRVEAGNEHVAERLTEKQKIEILDNRRHNCLLNYVYYVHFSGEHPECMNVSYTNLRSKHAYKYDETEKKFVIDSAEAVFKHLIDNRLTEVTMFFDEYKGKLTTKNEETMQEFINGMENDPIKQKDTLDNIMLMAYNNKDKVDIRNCGNIPDDVDYYLEETNQ